MRSKILEALESLVCELLDRLFGRWRPDANRWISVSKSGRLSNPVSNGVDGFSESQAQERCRGRFIDGMDVALQPDDSREREQKRRSK